MSGVWDNEWQEFLYPMSDLVKELSKQVKNFHANVATHQVHSTYVTRPMLKAQAQEIGIIYRFLMRLNDYSDPDEKLGKEVTRCEMIVEAMYAKTKK